ncbi:MAG TPA: alpha/beta hydrolase fold domain-containing protein [Anaerolineaceae bacterium]
MRLNHLKKISTKAIVLLLPLAASLLILSACTPPAEVSAAQPPPMEQTLSAAPPASLTPTPAATRTPRPTSRIKVIAHRNLQYSKASERTSLDLYLPEGAGPFPLVIWVHGGSWMSGNKDDCLLVNWGVGRQGYAIASVNYRLSDEAIFPAQIRDLKAAIRWLRAHAAEYRIDTQHIGLWGASAGGHLASLAGVSYGEKRFEEGENLEQSTRVNVVIDYYGPTDLIAKVTTPGFEARQKPDSPESKLMGGPILERRELAALANPLAYATSDDPPHMILHGDKDNVVPLSQSQMLDKALKKAHVHSQLIIIPGAGHGGEVFYSEQYLAQVALFLDTFLRPGHQPTK